MMRRFTGSREDDETKNEFIHQTDSLCHLTKLSIYFLTQLHNDSVHLLNKVLSEKPCLITTAVINEMPSERKSSLIDMTFVASFAFVTASANFVNSIFFDK